VNIAIFGATSQISKDLIVSFANCSHHECTLFARDSSRVLGWLNEIEIETDYCVSNYSRFCVGDNYDAIINFVGVGNPAQAKKMGSAIFDLTYRYDMMILDYLKVHPECKYLFLSSGVVYGGDFKNPATNEAQALIPINSLNETNWYMIAKLYAEARHRALPDFSIIDIRVFNYFSHTQDMDASFLITELVRAMQKKEVFKTSRYDIVRDFITPPDFASLVETVLLSPQGNMPIDCYTKEPVGKLELLSELARKYGLRYKLVNDVKAVNATGLKVNYYSTNRAATELGYVPQFSSITGILEQMSLLCV